MNLPSRPTVPSPYTGEVADQDRRHKQGRVARPCSFFLESFMRVVVLGIGNIILCDEGVGVRAAEALGASYALPDYVEVIDGGTAGMELLGPLSGVDLLVAMDAVTSGAAPGTIVKLAGSEVPVFFRTKLSPHQVGICDVLAGLEFSGDLPKDLVLIGIEPDSMELGLELTPGIAAKVPEMAAMAAAELNARGVPVRAKERA
jgi:hydrogenase maturation protease